MTVVAGILHVVAAVGFIGSALFAYRYYEQFFAADSPPLEWWLLLFAFGIFALMRLVRAVRAVVGTSQGVYIVIGELIAAGCCCVAGFILWNKVRL